MNNEKQYHKENNGRNCLRYGRSFNMRMLRKTRASTEPAAEITAKIQEDVKFPGMAEIGADRMAGYYDVAADKIDSYSAYICGSGAYPDEIAVFKMKSADDVNAVKSVLEKRVESQSATFKDYTPDEMYKIDGNNVVTSGNYVALIICADNAKAIEDFKAMAS